MSSLYQDFSDWQAKLALLQEQADILAERINELEKNNTALQQRLLNGEKDGFAALSDLYDDGYHICPPNFGQLREEDCLFCLSFLHHKGRPE